jgi:hypothetical protein
MANGSAVPFLSFLVLPFSLGMKEKRKTAPMEPIEHIIVAGLEAKKEI